MKFSPKNHLKKLVFVFSDPQEPCEFLSRQQTPYCWRVQSLIPQGRNLFPTSPERPKPCWCSLFIWDEILPSYPPWNEASKFTPKNGWLESYLPFGMADFQVLCEFQGVYISGLFHKPWKIKDLLTNQYNGMSHGFCCRCSSEEVLKQHWHQWLEIDTYQDFLFPQPVSL